MKVIGKVELILNKEFLIISSREDLSINQIITIFEKVENDEIKSKFDIDFISIPKGEVIVSNKESDQLYICKIFPQIQEKKRIITHPSPFDRVYAGALQSLFSATKEEIVETVNSSASAILDERQSLGLVLRKEVSVGDLAGIP